MRTSSLLWIAVAAGCGSKAPAPAEPVDTTPRLSIALVGVPAEALVDLNAVSYLSVDAAGKRSIGKLEGARGDINVSALAAVEPEGLGGWYDVSSPPVPLPPEERGGILGSSVFAQNLGWGDIGLGDGGLAGYGDMVETPCGVPLHLDFDRTQPVALLIADAAVDANVVLDTLDEMPRPVALLARGDDPRGRALRLVADGALTDITTDARVRVERGGVTADELVRRVDGERAQVAVSIGDGATAADLLTVLAGLAVAEVREVVINRHQTCKTYMPWGDPGYGFGGGGGYEGYDSDYGSIGYGGGGYDHVAVLVDVVLGSPKVKGGIDAAQVRQLVELHMADLLRCLGSEPAGKLTATFEIAADGSVRNAAASGATETANACVADVIAGVTFLPTSDHKTAKVTLPIEFAPLGE